MQTRKVVEHIVGWLDSYVSEAGLKGFVVGISGGIDSAVTSTLCALTRHDISVISMPIYQAKNQLDLANQHMHWLTSNFKNVNKQEVELTPVFQSMEQHFPASVQDALTMANTRSRLRMLMLYAYAGSEMKLVAGTGNKVEDFGVGFYTKYGDGSVDLSPIADLLKTEVYEISRELGILQAIQIAAPTDGLWENNRTDESQLGASYAELEWAMAFDNGELDDSVTEKSMTVDQQKTLAIYRKKHNENRHKMDPIPVCMIPAELKT